MSEHKLILQIKTDVGNFWELCSLESVDTKIREHQSVGWQAKIVGWTTEKKAEAK